MRALVLLLLCVVLLAVLQASYIVAEAKKHDEMRNTDKVDREARQQLKHEKKLRRKQKNKEDTTALESTDDGVYAEEQKLLKDDDVAAMPRDQPASERGGRRERVSKGDRRARKEQRQERKQQKQERKEQKQERQERKQERKEQRKAERQNKKQDPEREQRKKEKQERKEARQQKKAEKQAARGNKQPKVTCTSEADCGEGECCVPKRGGVMMCKANNKPRKAGKKCITSCTCEGDFQCFAETPAPDAPQRPRNRHMGRCTAPSAVDLTRGTELTAESRAAAAAAATPTTPAA